MFSFNPQKLVSGPNPEDLRGLEGTNAKADQT